MSLYEQLHKNVAVILLSGQMGAGKTEFARVWLKMAGVKGRIKSPSFSVVESYENTKDGTIHHIDLYRITHPYELIEIGIDEYCSDIILAEWPEKGWPEEMKYDLWVKIEYANSKKRKIKIKTAVKNMDAIKKMNTRYTK